MELSVVCDEILKRLDNTLKQVIHRGIDGEGIVLDEFNESNEK